MGTIEDLKNPHPSANRASPEESSSGKNASEETPSKKSSSEKPPSKGSRGSAPEGYSPENSVPKEDGGNTGTGRNGSSRDGSASSGRDRKRRVTVTPSNYDRLAQAAEKLGLSKAGVYNLAFSRLFEQTELDV